MTSAFLSLKPVSQPADFIGRRHHVRWLARMIGADRSECCSLVGMSKIGKTSLLAYLAHPDGARADLKPLAGRSLWAQRFVERTEIAVIPMQSLVERTATGVLTAVAHALHVAAHPPPTRAGPQPDTEERWRNMSAKALARECEMILAEFVRRAPSPDARVAIAFDDADILLRETGSKLKGLLRHLAAGPMRDDLADHLSFVMVTSAPLALLSDPDDVSDLTNIFPEEHLGLFSPDEARELIARSPLEPWIQSTLDGAAATGPRGPRPPPTLDEADAEFLLEDAGRHPDILKVACRHLLDAKTHLQKGGQGDVSWAAGPRGSQGSAGAPRRPPAALHTAAPEIRTAHEIVARRLRMDGHVGGVYNAVIHRLLMQPHLYHTAVDIARARRSAATGARPGDLGAVEWRTINDLARAGVVDDTAAGPRLFSRSFEEHLLLYAARHSEVPPAAAQIHELRYVPGLREVLVGDGRIRLTALESRLMEHFWERSNQVCGKDEILRAIWGPGHSATVLEKAVNRLRTKINRESHGVDYIMTVRGVGYMLRPRP